MSGLSPHLEAACRHPVDRVKEQRDELLAALKGLLTEDEMLRDRNRPEYQDRLQAARAAIARAEASEP
jgi:hypothetical protein